MADELACILEDVQKLLQTVNIRENTSISTMSRLANSTLVEKFLKESITMRPSGKMQSAEDRSELLHNHIYMCCFWGYRDVIKRILDLAKAHEFPIDLNRKNRDTLWTPLHAATFQEHGPVIMLLLENDADPHSCDSDGWTPVHFASVSDKIWAHFAARGLKRIPMNSLTESGLISNLPDSPSRSTSAKIPGQGIHLVNYGGQGSRRENDSSIGAARAGDVLAGGGDQQRPTSQRPISHRPISQIPF